MFKKHGKKTVNLSTKIYICKIENRFTFKINPGYYLEFLKLEIITLLGKFNSMITKFENNKNVPNLEITGVLLVHYNNYQQNSRVLYIFVQISHLVNY